jgi:superfamily I DNA and/or RNA helicase
MHPSIGDLVSHAFYRGKISNGTEDRSTGQPVDKVVHRFVAPSTLQGVAIVWVNVSGSSQGAGYRDGDEGVHLNQREIDAVARILGVLRPEEPHRETTAVLTPYRRQVRGLRSRLDRRPSWSILLDGYAHLDQDRVGVFTVDSFQGREASVVFVSLVRNNTERDIGRAFGFLREHE